MDLKALILIEAEVASATFVNQVGWGGVQVGWGGSGGVGVNTNVA